MQPLNSFVRRDVMRWRGFDLGYWRTNDCYPTVDCFPESSMLYNRPWVSREAVQPRSVKHF